MPASGRTSNPLLRLALRPGRSRERSSRPFLRFVLRRLAALVLLAIGITFVAFAADALVPGDPAAANLGQQAINDPAAVAAFRHHYGLDKPLPTQYGIYLWRLAARRPRRVRAEPRRRSRTTSAQCDSRHRRARDPLDPDRGHRRRHARGGRGDAPQQADRPRPARRLARRRVDADVLDRARRSLRLLLPAQLAARAPDASIPSSPSRRTTPASTRSTRCSPGSGARFGNAFMHLVLPALVLARLQHRPADALHALGGARGDLERLRARGPRQGTARANRDPAPRAARGSARRSSP